MARLKEEEKIAKIIKIVDLYLQPNVTIMDVKIKMGIPIKNIKLWLGNSELIVNAFPENSKEIYIALQKKLESDDVALTRKVVEAYLDKGLSKQDIIIVYGSEVCDRLDKEDEIKKAFPTNWEDIIKRISEKTSLNLKQTLKTSEDSKIINETKLLVNLFLQTNASDLELSRQTGISSSTVGRRLGNKNFIMAAFPENGEEIYKAVSERRTENLLRGKIIGSQVSRMNNQSSSEYPKLRLDIFYKDEKKQLLILYHMALTFRVKVPMLAVLFQFDERELLDKLLTLTNGKKTLDRALKYLLECDTTDQELAAKNLIEFYNEFLIALKNGNHDSVKEIISRVTDAKAQDLSHVARDIGDNLTDEEIVIMFNYQLKYALSTIETAGIFGVDRATLQKRFSDYAATDPNLNIRYEALSDYYYKNFFSISSGGRRGQG